MPHPVSTSSCPASRVTHRAAPPRLERLHLLLSCLQNHPLTTFNRRDALTPLIAARGTVPSALSGKEEAGAGTKGKKSRKVSWHYSSLVCRALTGRLGHLHRLDLKWATSPFPSTPGPCANTRLCINTHALDDTSWMIRPDRTRLKLHDAGKCFDKSSGISGVACRPRHQHVTSLCFYVTVLDGLVISLSEPQSKTYLMAWEVFLPASFSK